MLFFRINSWSQSVQSTDNQSDIRGLYSVFSFLLFFTFSLAGNIIVYTPGQGTKWGKNFIHNNYKVNMPTSAGNKQISLHFLLCRPRVFHLSTENLRV